MSVFLLAFVFFVVVMCAMAIGVIVANKPIKGSCGGLNSVGIDGACVICGKSGNEDLKNKMDAGSSTKNKQEKPLFYNAGK